MATCQVRLLGAFSVAVNSRPVSVDAWRTRRAADVVKLLSLQPGHRMHRERVIDALWPDLPPEAAAGNLRKAVHYARRALGSAEALQIADGLLHLWPGATLVVDVDRFERAAADALATTAAGDAARAAELYAGDLLPGDRYETWTDEPRRRLHDRYVQVLRAAEQWDRVLELDETDEEAHRGLMRRHLAAGRRREAIRQFEWLRDALREHIGVGPDPQTVALYEQVLATEGEDPPTPAERAAALIANGLVAWGRRQIEEAERLATEARQLALDAELGHELGEASKLLALVAYVRGTWHELFRSEFRECVSRGGAMETSMYDAQLCFQEFYLYGPEGHEGAAAFARELLAIAEQAGSKAGEAVATVLLGDVLLLSGNLEAAAATLEDAAARAEQAGNASALSLALERLAETEVDRGRSGVARELLRRARPIAESSSIPSHLVARILGVEVLAAETVIDALRVVRDGEHWMANSFRVCDPCSMTFRVEAARTCARAGDLARARRHIEDAERITGLWQGGPWVAAVWDARAELRRAEGAADQAIALFIEAAERFAQLRRPLEESRCRRAASAAGGARV